MPPLYMITLAAWWKVTGISIFTARLYSLAWGFALLAAGYSIMRKLTGSQATGLLAAALIATDYIVMIAAVNARMDMMSEALGYAGLAFYLNLRERNLRWAVLAGAACTAAAALTHPVGLMHSGGLILVALMFDWRRIGWREMLCGVAPYAVFGGIWGLYLLQSPATALEQFHAHAGYRVGGMSHPFSALFGDLAGRYAVNYSGPGVARYKILILVFYIAAAAAALAIPSIRRSAAGRVLLSLSALYYCELAWLDFERFPTYTTHICPLLAALVALVAAWMYRQNRVPKFALAGVLILFACFQMSGHVLKIRQDSYDHEYKPLIAFLRTHASSRTLIMGGAELFYGLGEGYRLVDDSRLGEESGLKPELVVQDSSHPSAQLFEADTASYVANLLSKKFRLAGQYGSYRVFVPVDSKARALLAAQ